MTEMSISKAWDESRAILAQNGRLLSILAFATVGLPSLLSTVMAPKEPATADEINGFTSLLLFFVALVALVGQLALARLAFPPATTVGEALRHGLRRLLPQIGAILILIAAIFALLIPVGIVAAASGVDVTRGAVMPALPGAALFVLLLVFIAIIFVAVRLMLATPVAALENVGSVTILRRSWELTRGHFWKLLGFLLMMLAAIVVISLAIAVTVGALVIMMFGAVEPWSIGALIIGLVQAAISTAFTLLFVVMLVRIYAQLSGRSAYDG
jgi:membrane-anchored glycerophosphoryl diester phosphodiesterase (GDPDase)